MRKGRFAGFDLIDEDRNDVQGALPVLLPLGLAALGPVAVVVTAIAAPGALPALAVGAWAAAASLLGVVLARSGGGGPSESASDPEALRAVRFLADFEQGGSGWFWETNADGFITYVSEPLAATVGRSAADLVGRRFEELLLVEDGGPAGMEQPTLGFHLSARFPFGDVIVSPNGRDDLTWSLSGRPCFDEIGRFLGFRGIAFSLSEEQRAQLHSSRAAVCDSLTGLPNRARMRAMLDEALANSDSRKEGCALMLIDLDRFKQVNDSLGHPVGDLLLKEVAQRISAVIGSDGQAGRLGGDEFESVLPGIDEEGRLAELAETLIAKVSEPYVVRGHSLSIGASVGIAISRPGKTLADALVKEADLALYAAKDAGRGTFRFFEPAMHAQERERQMLGEGLRYAVGQGQLRLVFQPVVSAASEDLVGFEALLRWSHPVRGLLAPAEFLSLAESSGLIIGIGEWAIRAACDEAAKWPKHLRLTVNLSPVQLEQAGLAATIAGALASADLDPDRLELDLPEAALLAQNPAVATTLAGLKNLGVRLALDDFGSGPSSVISLKSAPLDRLKIHPSMIHAALPDGGRAQSVLAAVVQLAAGLGMGVTAEGAETLDELALIRRIGCTDIQGFLFGRPMSAEEALDLAAQSAPVSAQERVQSRPPRHSLIRRGALIWDGGSIPVRLRNISADGAMIESTEPVEPGAEVELDLSGGVRLAGEVRWSQEGRVGIKFAEAFDLQRLGRARGAATRTLRPDYLASENSPTSPWAARYERLTIKEVKKA